MILLSQWVTIKKLLANSNKLPGISRYAICLKQPASRTPKLLGIIPVLVRSVTRSQPRCPCMLSSRMFRVPFTVPLHIPNSRKCFVSYYTPPPPRTTKLLGGYTGFTPSVRPSVRLSVRPSVRPSVPHAVSALYHLQLWTDSFHIRHKWSLPWEGVSRTMTFDLDLYLQGHSALT